MSRVAAALQGSDQGFEAAGLPRVLRQAPSQRRSEVLQGSPGVGLGELRALRHLAHQRPALLLKQGLE